MRYHPHSRRTGLLLLFALWLFMSVSTDQGEAAGDAAGVRASHWSIDPAHETVKSRVSYVPGLKVVRGATQVIVPEHESFCPAGSVFRFNNGDIQVHDRRSSDGGATWAAAGHILENSTYQFPGPDGEVVLFQSSFTNEHVSGEGRPEVSMTKTGEPGVYEAKFFRSADGGVTRVSDPARIHLPPRFDDWRGVLCRKIVGLEDGSLLVSMYCRKEEGTPLERKYRSLVLRSEDRGKTWHYLSTIAFDTSPDARGEGFDETCLLPLPDGRLLAFLRSGASYQASIGSFNNGDPEVDMPFGYAKQTPVYLATSFNGGAHWGIPDPVSPFGVWPDAARMESGILAVSYGRPGNWLMFSQDDGATWGPIIPFFHDLYPPDCSNYASIAEVAPNVLLVVYARTNPNDHWRSELAGTYFQVLRDAG